jgi:tetratricopeptide (TPR) repeat protein
VVAGSLALGALAPEAHAQDNTAFAQQRFARGASLYETRSFAEALEEFRASLTLYSSPNTRLYVARCLRELDRFDEAIPEFERTVREAADRASTDPRYAATREAAQNELRSIEPRIARVTLTVPEVPPGARVRIAGREVPVAALGVSVPVLPGHVTVVVEAEGYLTEERALDLTAGADERLTVALRRNPALEGHQETPWQPPPPPPPPPPPGRRVPLAVAWSALGLGGAGLLGFGIFAGLASARFSDLERQCGGTACPPELGGSVSGGRTLQTLTNVSLGVGLAGLTAGALLWVLGGPPSRPAVRVGFGGNSLTFEGTF